jgi:murein DD-endopeptidase MepM/ murein hydrolase activator NlpD
MSGLSLRFRASAVVIIALAAFGSSLGLAPAVGHRSELGPRSGGPLAVDLLDRDRLMIDVSRSVEPVHLVWPADGLKTGWFGEGRGSHSHPGVDVDGDTGDPVWAAGRGAVIAAGPAPAGYSGYGTIVEIDHGQGIKTLYAHLSRVDVAVGDLVDARTVLGAMGTSGNVTGSHLHFEVRVGDKPVDPEDWLPPRPNRPTTGPRPAEKPAAGSQSHLF